MKLLLVIDHFGTGGAQRQIVNLAKGLISNGHEVNFFIYYPEYENFRAEVEELGINIIEYSKNKQGFNLKILWLLSKVLKKNNYDVALAYLETPSIYLLLAGICTKTKLIVSDRTSYLSEANKLKLKLKRQIYRLSNYIITNSETQRKWLVESAGLPKNKVETIYNGFDSQKYVCSKIVPSSLKTMNLIAIGSIRPVKNLENIIVALDLLLDKYGVAPKITWVGKVLSESYYMYILKLLEDYSRVRSLWSWLGERNDVSQLLSEHHALIISSYYEGLPNVVCEALFSGKPVLASNVCDNPILINDGIRGFLFDPNSPKSIANAIYRLSLMTTAQWEQMSLTNRFFAENNLALDIMVSNYEQLFKITLSSN